MFKWLIFNKTTGEIYEPRSARYKYPHLAYSSLRAHVRNSLTELSFDAGDQLQGEVLTENDDIVAQTPVMDAAYFPSYSWAQTAKFSSKREL